MTPLYIAFLSGFAWLALKMLGVIALTAFLTWLLARFWYGRKNPSAVHHHGKAHQGKAQSAESHDKTIANLRNSLEKERSGNSKVKSELQSARQELESLRTKLAGVEKSTVPVAKLQAAESAKNQAAAELKAIKDARDKAARDFESAKSERQTLANKLQELSVATVPVEKWNEAQRRFEVASKEAEALKADDAARTAKAKETREALENLRRDHNRALDELAKLKNDLGSRTAARDELASNQHQTNNKVKELEDERNKLAFELEQLRRASVPKGELINMKAALAEKEKEAAQAKSQLAILTAAAAAPAPAATPVQTALAFEPPMQVAAPQSPPQPTQN